ncbi:MAG: malonyl-CoA synthase [Pseudomonadota bacterium]
MTATSETGNHLADGLLATARQHPDRPFAEVLGGPVTRYYSYADADRVSARFALALRGLGVKPGDRVAVQVEKSIEALMLYLATVRAGAVFLPLNTAYTPAEIAYFLSDAAPSLAVCDPVRAEALGPHAAAVGARLETMGVWQNPEAWAGSLFDHVPDSADGFADTPRGPDDLAAILYTSGTTGRSKGAMLSHRNLASNAEVLVDHWRFSEADRLIHALPIFHTHGLFVATNVALMAGAGLIFMPRFEVEMIVEALPRATAMMGVPTFYTRLLADPRLDRDLTAGIRLFVSGSAPLLAETHEAWHARTGHAILERYGMTECNMNTSNPYDGERRPGTVGMALPGVDLRVCAPGTADPVAPGETGMIEVRGPNVFQGYWQNPEKTAEDLRPDGWLITGDLGRVDDDGYLLIVGRAKDLIISGGFNVYPKEVEAEIDALPGVVESAVIGLPHPDFGEGVAAVVVPDGAGALTEADILTPLGQRLAKFKQPKRVFFVPELPRNAMGKVQKKALREGLSDTFA